jgi:hypothetical protein
MTDEQLQKLIEHKVQEATAPLERRWEMLRKNLKLWRKAAADYSDVADYENVLQAMNDLEKVYEPRRKLPTDPRRKNKLDK